MPPPTPDGWDPFPEGDKEFNMCSACRYDVNNEQHCRACGCACCGSFHAPLQMRCAVCREQRAHLTCLAKLSSPAMACTRCHAGAYQEVIPVDAGDESLTSPTGRVSTTAPMLSTSSIGEGSWDPFEALFRTDPRVPAGALFPRLLQAIAGARSAELSMPVSHLRDYGVVIDSDRRSFTLPGWAPTRIVDESSTAVKRELAAVFRAYDASRIARRPRRSSAAPAASAAKAPAAVRRGRGAKAVAAPAAGVRGKIKRAAPTAAKGARSATHDDADADSKVAGDDVKDEGGVKQDGKEEGEAEGRPSAAMSDFSLRRKARIEANRNRLLALSQQTLTDGPQSSP